MEPTMDGEAPGSVSIRLMGGFGVSVGGRDVADGDWPGRRAAELVQLLALAQRHRLPREEVVEALWPRLDAAAGAANLRKAAHHARHALARADAVVLQGGQVQLCPDGPIETDVERFERLADAALARGAADACAAAAQAWGGELLPGARYEPWTAGARTRLRARYLDLLRAAGDLERLAREEPTDEATHRALMRAALAAGSRPAAIRWYGRLRTALARGLGMAPSPETEALYDECVAGLAVAGHGFVGRQMALAQAEAVLRTDDADRPGGLVVRGPAGIGKSALCREVARLARDAGWFVVAVDAHEAGRPYGVVASAAEQALLGDRTVLDRIGEHARSVLAILTPLAAPAPPLPGPLGRHQVVGALRRLLLAAGGARRAMLVVDDAYLADAASAEVLLQLAASGRPVLVVQALRPRSSHPDTDLRIERLVQARRLATIELGPLDPEESAVLVARATPGTLGATLVERIVALSEGNPFAALELARAAQAGPSLALPASTRDAITQRLCEVDDGTAALLGRLALAGDEHDTAMVVALTGGDEAQALGLLDRALEASVLVVSGDRYRFRHELVRQALIERVPPHRRLALHRDAAQALAGLDASPGLVARHWLAGERPGEALPWLLRAGRDAQALGAFADAVRHADAALALAADHAEALRIRAESLDAMGDVRTLGAYDAAIAALEPQAAHELRAKRALAQVKMGDPRGALVALEGVAPTTVEGRLAEALAYSGAAALGAADPAMGTAKSAECRRIALQSGDTASLVIASWAQAAAAHARGDLHGSVWADLRETHALPHLAVRVFDGHLCITQRFLYGARPYADVIAFADALGAEARRLGAARGHAFAVTLRGEARMLAGDLDGAAQDLADGGRMHRAIGGATGEALSLQRRAEVAMYRGRHAEASHMLDDALDVARQSDVGFHLLDRIYGTRIAMARDPDEALGALADAEDAVRGPLETCPGCRITFAVPATIAAARGGELDLAVRHERAADYLANVVMRLPAWNAALLETRAHIARAAGDRDRAAAGFAAAALGFDGAEQPLDAARCRTLAGGGR
jgi:DNA-binding SARP family transcriptional activator